MKSPGKLALSYANSKFEGCNPHDDEADVQRNYCIIDFLAGYQAAQPQWISVNERLPEVGAPCLITCHEERYAIAEYDGIKWTTLNSIAYYHPIVTHWQGLPEAPKEEG